MSSNHLAKALCTEATCPARHRRTGSLLPLEDVPALVPTPRHDDREFAAAHGLDSAAFSQDSQYRYRSRVLRGLHGGPEGERRRSFDAPAVAYERGGEAPARKLNY